MFIDSHCHLNMLKDVEIDALPEPINQEPNLSQNPHSKIDKVLVLAKEAGVEHLLTVSVSLDDYEPLLQICEKHPQVSMSVGVHPCEKPMDIDFQQLKSYAEHKKVVAIGETGLDYYWSKDAIKWQQEQFITHIELAKELQKPLIIHTRESKEDTISILKEHQADTCKGVMHCFTEDWEMAKQSLDLGFYISMSGIVTFKNATIIQEVASKMPLDRMLIETDSPYLAPVPKRGKANFPHYVPHVAHFIAKLRGLSVDEIAHATTQNFYKLFSLAAR